MSQDKESGSGQCYGYNFGENLCQKCGDTGVHLSNEIPVIPVFCDCLKGRKLGIASEQNPEGCVICGGRGNIPVAGSSIEPQCSHVGFESRTLAKPQE